MEGWLSLHSRRGCVLVSQLRRLYLAAAKTPCKTCLFTQTSQLRGLVSAAARSPCLDAYKSPFWASFEVHHSSWVSTSFYSIFLHFLYSNYVYISHAWLSYLCFGFVNLCKTMCWNLSLIHMCSSYSPWILVLHFNQCLNICHNLNISLLKCFSPHEWELCVD